MGKNRYIVILALLGAWFFQDALFGKSRRVSRTPRTSRASRVSRASRSPARVAKSSRAARTSRASRSPARQTVTTRQVSNTRVAGKKAGSTVTTTTTKVDVTTTRVTTRVVGGRGYAGVGFGRAHHAWGDPLHAWGDYNRFMLFGFSRPFWFYPAWGFWYYPMYNCWYYPWGPCWYSYRWGWWWYPSYNFAIYAATEGDGGEPDSRPKPGSRRKQKRADIEGEVIVRDVDKEHFMFVENESDEPLYVGVYLKQPTGLIDGEFLLTRVDDIQTLDRKIQVKVSVTDKATREYMVLASRKENELGPHLLQTKKGDTKDAPEDVIRNAEASSGIALQLPVTMKPLSKRERNNLEMRKKKLVAQRSKFPAKIDKDKARPVDTEG